jgi:hypothetical protein
MAFFLYGTFATLTGLKALVLTPHEPLGAFNPDCYMATAWARHYLGRPGFDLTVHDMYTQGFVHPFIYVPILGLLDLLGVPSAAQDDLAISAVYAITAGLIVALAFLCGRAYLRREAAATCAVLSLMVLVFGTDMDSNSPNGEMLGSVLLLLLWALLIHARHLRFWLPAAVLIGTIGFHLKYQLAIQILLFIWLSDQSRQDKRRLTLYLVLASILLDLIVFRLGGEGILSKAGALVFDYSLSGIGDSGKLGSISQSIPLLLNLLLSILAYTPQILIAWLCWLYGQTDSPSGEKQALADMKASALMIAGTFAAILLPAKGYAHYNLLLIPTTTFVMVLALRNSRLSGTKTKAFS